MASYSGRNGKERTTYSRDDAKKIAASKTYTAKGKPIRNLSAYVAAGGRPRNSGGDVIRNPMAYQNAIEASVRQNTNDPKYLYHYTNQQAAKSISESGTIHASTNGLAGPGTYCTAKPPRCNTGTLLNNNYSNAVATRDQSYVDNYVRMDADRLNARHVGNGNRDGWKVKGDVDLGQHNAFVAERHQDCYGGEVEHEGHQHYYDGYDGMDDDHDDF